MALRNGVIAREKRKTIVHGSSHSVPTFAAAASTFYGIRENSWSDQKVCYRVPAMTNPRTIRRHAADARGTRQSKKWIEEDQGERWFGDRTPSFHASRKSREDVCQIAGARNDYRAARSD